MYELMVSTKNLINELAKNNGDDHDYKNYMDRLEKAMKSSQPMSMKDMHNRLGWEKGWSEEIGAPRTTTEAWGGGTWTTKT